MQLLRANSACERNTRAGSCRTAWSCNSHQKLEDSRCQTSDDAGSVTVRELADKIQQAEQLLLARLENIVASAVTCKSNGQHAGRRKDAGLREHIGTVLAAFEHLHNRVEVRSDAVRAVAADAAQRLRVHEVECLTQANEAARRPAADSWARRGAGKRARGRIAASVQRSLLGQDSDDSDAPASDASSASSGFAARDLRQQEAMLCSTARCDVMGRRRHASPDRTRAPWWPPSAPGGCRACLVHFSFEWCSACMTVCMCS